jgi:hypothetical protein
MTGRLILDFKAFNYGRYKLNDKMGIYIEESKRKPPTLLLILLRHPPFTQLYFNC